MRYFVVCIFLFCVGCSSASPGSEAPSQVLTVSASGAALGSGVGAGLGALVGSLITRGSVAHNAWAGAGIGIPVGAVLGASYAVVDQRMQLAAQRREIEENARRLQENGKVIEALRESYQSADREPIVLDRERREYLFTGPVLGNVYRP